MASHAKYSLDVRIVDNRLREFGKDYQFYNKEPSVALKAFNNYLSECGFQTIGSKTFNAALIRVFGLAAVLVTVNGKCVRRLRS